MSTYPQMTVTIEDASIDLEIGEVVQLRSKNSFCVGARLTEIKKSRPLYVAFVLIQPLSSFNFSQDVQIERRINKEWVSIGNCKIVEYKG